MGRRRVHISQDFSLLLLRRSSHARVLLFLVPSLQADWKKLRVKELRKICDDEGIDAKGFMEKEEYLKAIKKHFNIKDEV